MNDDRNYISVWSWMLMTLVVTIPVVGWIMIIVWAFAGDNQTRKNYFRAMLMWVVLFIALFIALMMLGVLGSLVPQIVHH